MAAKTWVQLHGGWVENPDRGEPFEFDGTVWQSPATRHGDFMVYREWYAHGPTLYDWIAEDVGTGQRQFFGKKRDAVAFAEAETEFFQQESNSVS